MRFTLLGAVSLAALTVGCAATEGDLAYRGSLNNVETNGVVMFDNGETGHAGMMQTTCGIDADGGVREDINVTDADTEVVVDGAGDGSSVLTRTRGELQVVPLVSGFGDPNIQTIEMNDVQTAHFTDAGIAAATSCNVQWLDDAGLLTDSTDLSDLGCASADANFDVDTASGTAFLTLQGDVHAVTPEGVTPLATGDVFAFNATQNGLVTANAGENTVSFVGIDGTARWSTDVGAAVVSVEELGSRGYVAAMVENGVNNDGETLGRLVVLDGTDGTVLLSQSLPGLADIVASGNGETLAMVLPNSVHYYTLNALID